MSVDFCDARQGGGAYGKTPATWPSSCSWSFAHMFFPASRQGGGAYGKTPATWPSSCSWSFAHMFFPALSPDSVDNCVTVFV
nr:hypothetical protein [Salmonella enterica]